MGNRKEIEQTIYKTLSLIDKTNMNTKKYQEMLSSMSDVEFDTYMGNFINDKKSNFYMEILPYKNEPLLIDIKEAADYLKVPFEEYVYYQHDGNKDNPIRSKTKVSVGYLPLKRYIRRFTLNEVYLILLNFWNTLSLRAIRI